MDDDDNYEVPGLQEVNIFEDEDSNRPPSESPSTSDDEDTRFLVKKLGEIPPQYWQMQKLVKFVKAGNPTATVIALSCILDYDLKNDVMQAAIQDIGGLEVLLNILETNDIKSKLGALSVLAIISENIHIKRTITDQGGIPVLVKALTDPARDIQTLAAETIANVAKMKSARKKVRNCLGIPKLVDLLDVSEKCLHSPREVLSKDDLNQVEIAGAGARALWSLSFSPRNREAMKKSGVVPLLARLIKSVHMDVVKSTMGTLQGCASQDSYQLAIKTENMIPDIVRYLTSDDVDLQLYCASCLFKCSVDKETCDKIRKAGGLDPLVNIIKDSKYADNKPLLAAAAGAIWTCAVLDNNVKRLDNLGTIPILVGLLADDNEEVLANVAGAISQLTRFQHNVDSVRTNKGIPLLVNHLNAVYKPLLENIPLALAQCAKDPAAMAIIEELDGVRLIWSLLKNTSNAVKANAAWALRPCIENASDSGNMVRSFVGALELMVELLDSNDAKVLAGVCAAIATIARDIENLAVMTDHGVVPKLAKLVHTKDENLREYLADAIGYCCSWSDNRHQFGKLGVITPLVAYLAGTNVRTHKTTVLALYHLSEDPLNCITMHQSGVVPFLLLTVSSKNSELQDSSAGALCNIRRLALAAEKFKMKL